MKIIHTADWHLGDNFHGFDRQAEHRDFLDWLKELITSEKPDALLISGDVFDNANPSAQAEELLYDFLTDIAHLHPGIQTIITAGNHDSGRRLQAPAAALRTLGVEIRGFVQHDDKGTPLLENLIVPIHAVSNPEETAVVLAVPYIRPTDLEVGKSQTESVRGFFQALAKQARKLYGKQVRLVLMAHLYAAGAEVALDDHSERLVVGGEDCINVDGLDHEAAYVALGHIHKAQQVGGADRMVFYAGSPIPMSFAEKHYHHGVNKVVLGPNGGIMLDQIEYTPLRSLMSFPDQGAAPLADILKQIKQLPSKNKEDSNHWPYIEIRLQEGETGLTAQNDILNALDDKAARLCKLIKVAPQPAPGSKKKIANSLEQLRNRIPLDIALDAYLQATGKEMDDELIERFNSVVKATHHDDLEQQ